MPTYFAEIAPDGLVLRVIVSSAQFCAKLGGEWVQTVMLPPQARKNYAGPGYRFDVGRNAFIPPKPHADATLDETTCRWVHNAPMPGAEIA